MFDIVGYNRLTCLMVVGLSAQPKQRRSRRAPTALRARDVRKSTSTVHYWDSYHPIDLLLSRVRVRLRSLTTTNCARPLFVRATKTSRPTPYEYVFLYSAHGRGAGHCDECVCSCVCTPAYLSQIPLIKTSSSLRAIGNESAPIQLAVSVPWADHLQC